MDGSRHAPQRRIYEACHNLLSKVEKKWVFKVLAYRSTWTL